MMCAATGPQRSVRCSSHHLIDLNMQNPQVLSAFAEQRHRPHRHGLRRPAPGHGHHPVPGAAVAHRLIAGVRLTGIAMGNEVLATSYPPRQGWRRLAMPPGHGRSSRARQMFPKTEASGDEVPRVLDQRDRRRPLLHDPRPRDQSDPSLRSPPWRHATVQLPRLLAEDGKPRARSALDLRRTCSIGRLSGARVDGIQNTVRPPVVARTPPLLHTVARRRAPAPRALVSSFSFLLEEVSLHGVLVREHSCAACSPSASWALPHDPRGQLPLAGGPVLFLRENLLTAYSRCGDMPHASPGWDAVSRNKRLSPAWAAQRLAHWDGLSGAP